ncbi:MAG: hypothetical protein ABEJ42_07380 [Halobacteriaceae archaeon]
MPSDATAALRPTCANCEFAAPAGSDEWATAEHPTLGTLTRCPECGSTAVSSRGSQPP